MCLLLVLRFSTPEFTPKTTITKHYQYFRNAEAPLKIYLYNTTISDQKDVCKGAYCDPNADFNQKNHFIFEYIIHQNLIHSKTKVENPEDADLFFVPIYLSAYSIFRKKTSFQSVILPYLADKRYWFDKHGGVDHIFTQIYGINSNVKDLPSMLTLGDFAPDSASVSPRELWRYTIVPYSSNYHDFDNNTRRIFAAFFESHTSAASTSQIAKNLRTDLITEMSQMRNSLAIAKKVAKDRVIPTFDVDNFMSISDFCPSPSGETANSKRFFDALKLRCIPVLLSDDIHLPFEELFADYSGAVIQIPMRETRALPATIGMMTSKQMKQIRMRMSDISNLLNFSWTYEDHNGDIIWAWKWTQYFKAATIAASKRREPIRNKYYKPKFYSYN